MIADGPIAAVASRIGLDRFDPARLQGATAEDVRWLGEVAARHNEIICRAAESSAVLPLRLGTIFRSPRFPAGRALALPRQAWPNSCNASAIGGSGASNSTWRSSASTTAGAVAGPPSPHYLPPARTGTDYLTRKKAQLESRRELRAAMQRTVRAVEECLAGKAEQYLPHPHAAERPDRPQRGNGLQRGLSSAPSAQEGWLEAIDRVRQDVQGKGLLLELSGPWPPYHFCPSLEL